MTAPVARVIQGYEPGSGVVLYDVDLSVIDAGSPVLSLTSNQHDGGTISRGGVVYWPAPIEGTGFDLGADGKWARPTVTISNILSLLGPWVWGGGDLLGAVVTRTITLARYLDGWPDEDSAAYLRRDVYTIRRKTSSDAEAITFELGSKIDAPGKHLPNRQAIADTCPYRYRRWTGSAWDGKATCPYVGTDYFDIADNVVLTEAEDVCGKTLLSCKARFEPGPLPTGAFPSLRLV